MNIRKIPLYFVLLLVFTVPWQMVVSFEEFGTISKAVGYITIAIAILYVFIYRKVKEPSLIIILMVSFILWSLFSYFWGVNPSGAISRFVTNIQLLAMVWLLWETINTKRELLLCLQAFIFGSYISIFDMLISFFTNQYTTFRIAATGFNPNQLAISLAIGIPIAWYLITRRKNDLLLYVNFIYISFALFCIVLTASRGGLITAVVGLLIIPLTFYQLQSTKKAIVTIGIIIVIIVGSIKYPSIASNIERNLDRLSQISDNIEQRDLGIRGTLISYGLQIFKENPILGVGARGFAESVVEAGHSRTHTAHNTYLSVLVEFGIIGFILFISIFLFSIIPNLSINRVDKYFYIILFITMCIGLFPIRWEANKITWLLLAFFMLQNTFVIRKNRLELISNK
jgi:O-antigen ligase